MNQQLSKCIALVSVIGMGHAELHAETGCARIEITSISYSGQLANASATGQISRNGRFMLLRTTATNLAPGATNTFDKFILRDLLRGTSSQVNVSSDGSPGNASASRGATSADGRFIIFDSAASNLVVNDVAGWVDVFLHDSHSLTTERISIAWDGSELDGFSNAGYISADGRYVTLWTAALNAVPVKYTSPQIILRDRMTDETSIVSIMPNGLPAVSEFTDGGAISDDGQLIVFTGDEDFASPSGQMYVHHRPTGQTIRISNSPSGSQANHKCFLPSISADGQFIVYISRASNLVSGDTNNVEDVFLYDRKTCQTTRVNVSSAGQQANAATTLARISADGRYILFSTMASNLVEGDTNGVNDGFIHDRITGTTTRITVNCDGTQFNASAGASSISGDGRFVSINTAATNITGQPSNGFVQTYVREIWKAGDLNHDGIVNVDDLVNLLGAWGPCENAPYGLCPSDITPLGGDGIVNVDDLVTLLANWG